MVPKPQGSVLSSWTGAQGTGPIGSRAPMGPIPSPSPNAASAPPESPRAETGERGEVQVQRSSQNSGLRPSWVNRMPELWSPRAVTMTQFCLGFWPSRLAKPSFGRSWEDNGQRRIWHGNGVSPPSFCSLLPFRTAQWGPGCLAGRRGYNQWLRESSLVLAGAGPSTRTG